jgi:hypothetical protein
MPAIPGCSGGGKARRRRPAGAKKAKKESAWASTGRSTTCKDGVRRTVYRNLTTGALATRRVVKKAGAKKKTVRYVKV